MSPALLRLCDSADLADNSSKGFTLGERQLFLVRKRGRVFAYINRCPHVGLPLNWLPDQFLDVDRELILCSSHGALFKIDSGHCVAGPCVGQQLQALACREQDGGIFINAEST